MTSANNQPEDPTFVPFTKAERIQQLNDIDKSVSKLLQSAVLAIKSLSASRADASGSASARREEFESASNAYLETLQSVDVRLRRQIYGLEEASIIPPEKTKSQKVVVRNERDGPTAEHVAVTEGSLGKLDIGWLNSRSGRVGRDMEAELWGKAKTFMEGLEETKTTNDSKDHDMTD